jgi:HK97 family phage major capsid protein
MRKQKLERYRALIQEQRDFLDNTVPTRVAETPEYDFQADESFKARATEINSLSVWLQEDNDLQERARQFDNPGSGAGREDTRGGQEGQQSTEQEQRTALYRLMTDGPDRRDTNLYGSVLQRASLSTASGAVGGFLVPVFVEAAVIQDLEAIDDVRSLGARVMPINGRENLPSIVDAAAVYQSESGAISGMTRADPTFANIEIRPALLSANTHYGWHVQSFSPANVEEEIKRSFGRSLGKKAAEKFLVGTGSDEPEGLLEGASTGVTAASETTFTAVELTALWYSLAREFQAGSSWLLSAAAATVARTLESDNGAPLWVPNLRDGSETLFGRPVRINPYMESLATSNRPIVVGDMAEAYIIAESGVFIVVDPYTRAANAENRVIAYRFSDGRVKRAAAAKKLVMDDGL